MLIVFEIISCVLLLNVIVLRCHETNETNSSSNFTKLFLRKLLRNIDVKQNLLLAPLEIEKLYTRLQSETFESDFELENIESRSFADVTNPIKVCNSVLHRRVAEVQKGENAADAIIINSVTLRTRWAHNFQRRETHKHHFHAETNSEIYTDAMNKDDYFSYAELPELNASALELTLEGHYIRLLILLPDEVNGLAHMLHKLSEQLTLLDELQQQTNATRRARLRSTLVRVIMPKFSITHSEPLNGYFTSEIFPAQLTLRNQVYQETHIKVNEHGIGDMERTNVLFWNAYSSLRVAPKVFDMNHPFLFLIYDNHGLQFIGQVAHISAQ